MLWSPGHGLGQALRETLGLCGVPGVEQLPRSGPSRRGTWRALRRRRLLLSLLSASITSLDSRDNPRGELGHPLPPRRSVLKVTPAGDSTGTRTLPYWLPAHVLTTTLHSHLFRPEAMGRGEGRVPLRLQ